MYRPCAPDGFIPNSVVRELYNIDNDRKPANVKEEDEWKPPVWLDEWGDINKFANTDDDDGGTSLHPFLFYKKPYYKKLAQVAKILRNLRAGKRTT